MPNSRHRCHVCNQTFSSRNHLRRHEASHNPQDQIACEFCNRKYSRNDALRRHYKSCPGIGIHPQPDPGRRGRHRKACDNCAKNRVLCDGGLPCAACQGHQTSCTYRRLEADSSEPLGLLSDTPAVSHGIDNMNARLSDRTSVPFLLNYSAPTNPNPGDVNHALSLLSTAETRDQDLDPALPSFDIEVSDNLLFEDPWNLFFGSYPRDADSQTSLTPSGLDDPIERQLAVDRIIECLNSTCTTHPHITENNVKERANEFFCEENVREFTNAYFEHTVRPRSRIVLKTTFELKTISAPLLLSLLLMGAACSASDNARLQAAEYATMAEFAVFESPAFLRLMYRKREVRSQPLAKNDIEIMQAALVVSLIQIPSPSAEARRRIRIQRYPALVSVARTTSLTQIKNCWHDSSSPLNREEFLRNEACIRLMASISMLDCHFIMFFNQPPNLTPTELKFDLPAEENGIDISDDLAWEAWAKNERKYQRAPTLSEFLQELMSDTWMGPEDPRFENLNIFVLFIVASAFHRIVFGIRSSICDVSGAINQVDRALQRWMSLWERLQARLSQEEIYRAGFMMHAQDLLVFAKILLRKPLSETGEIAKDSMSHVHFLLKSPLRSRTTQT